MKTVKGFSKIVAMVGAVALGLTLSACGNTNSASNTDSKNSGSTPTVSFMLDWTPNTNHIGLYVAQKLGYYKDAGVNVKILPTAQAGAETSVENGVANVGFTTRPAPTSRHPRTFPARPSSASAPPSRPRSSAR